MSGCGLSSMYGAALLAVSVFWKLVGIPVVIAGAAALAGFWLLGVSVGTKLAARKSGGEE